MFTGIITDIGTVERVETRASGLMFRIATRYDPDGIDIGASIACAGVCLTVTDRGRGQGHGGWFDVEAWEEALRMTTASRWAVGTRLNLERALTAGDEYGGHMVSGHVDAMAGIVSVRDEGEARRFTLEAPVALARFIAPKGSIALDGTSLTVNGVEDHRFDVLLIRHSLAVTTWGEAAPGDRVNLEIDTIARYVARYVDHMLPQR